ncbi:hypothetical protein H2O64_06385 [Kordia sp. YSTF-M3]|uniref:Uncharacterized protein n=1 Tax=Kordia aestuariivivens TaxID=2759037 RepID=A0ABR7Q6U3_9FLAO|nr:hypothetical protein [Kordia aestuariivivens]MBC8754291.1 hypothetical protein [Kordia aestuariivivens]
MKKTNLIKQYTFIFSSICLFLLLGLATSCQKEEITSPEEVATEEATDLKYFFDGIEYNKEEWNDYLTDSKTDKDSYYYTMAENKVYVHNSADQYYAFQEFVKQAIESGENLASIFLNKSSCYFASDLSDTPNYYYSNGDIFNGEAYRYCSEADYRNREFITLLTLYKDIDFGGSGEMRIYFADYVEEAAIGGWGGLRWKEINSGSIDLPSEFKDEVSSFKYEVLAEPDLYAIYGNSIRNYRIVWTVDLVGTTALLDGTCAFRKSLAINKNNDGTYNTNRKYEDDKNLHNNRAYSCGTLSNWGDRADYVRFKMTGNQIN